MGAWRARLAGRSLHPGGWWSDSRVMSGFLPIAGFVVLAIVAAYLSYSFKQRRRAALAQMARQLGMRYSPQDEVGCLNYPFALLARGDGRGTENVVWGTWQGIPMTEFDYWYYDESTDSKGNWSRTNYRFSCAITRIAAQCAHLSLDREGILTRLADHLGLEFESGDFNQRFNVTCTDRKFANDLIDSRMIQWLLVAHVPRVVFDLYGTGADR